MSTLTYKKNYIREGLDDLAEKSNGSPIAFQGIFRSDRTSLHGRFFVSNIKLYSIYCSGSSLYMLTSHVMLSMSDAIADKLRGNEDTNKPIRRKVIFIGYIYIIILLMAFVVVE